MTSSNGNIFHVTGPLCGEFSGRRWIPLTKTSDAGAFSVACYLPHERDVSVSNHRPLNYLFNSLLKPEQEKISSSASLALSGGMNRRPHNGPVMHKTAHVSLVHDRFHACAQPVRYVVTKWHRLSLGGRKPRISHAIILPPWKFWKHMADWRLHLSKSTRVRDTLVLDKASLFSPVAAKLLTSMLWRQHEFPPSWLNHCSLVTPHDVKDLCQHSSR